MMLDRQPISSAPKHLGERNTVWLGDDDGHLWGGFWNGEKWVDRDDADAFLPYPHSPCRYGQPTWWAPMLPENTHRLPEEKDDAGQNLLTAVDHEPIQGVAWVHGSLGWKYFLVTPDISAVATAVRQYFRDIPQNVMTLDDIAIVGPNDHTFQILAMWHVNFRGRAEIEGSEFCLFGFRCWNGDTFDIRTRINAVVYRALKTLDGSDFRRPERLVQTSSLSGI